MSDQELIKQLQEELKQAKAEIFRLESVIDTLPGSIYWKDKDGKYIGRNITAAHAMVSEGYERKVDKEAVLGFTDAELFSQEAAEQMRKHDLQVMEHENEVTLEEWVTKPDGQTAYHLSTKKPLYNEEGEVVGVIGNTIDITKQKMIEKELRVAKNAAEQASRIKTEFLQNMQHDIRTPFNGILGLGHYLWQIEENPEKREYLADINACTQELLDFCNGIIDYSRIELDSHPVQHDHMHVRDLINRVMVVGTPIAKQKHIQLTHAIASDVPETVYCDEYRLYRILINLVGNAIKFTEDGSVKLKVSLEKTETNQIALQFTISDTGIGIPKDKLDYIFLRFSRITPSNRGKYPGLGLGLKIVEQFVYELNGKISIDSELDRGTIVSVSLPIELENENGIKKEL